MPRYARTLGDTALNREIDRLWQFHDALSKKIDALLAAVRLLQASAGSSSTGNVLGATGGSGGTGTGSGTTTSSSADTSATVTDAASTSRMASVAQGWAAGGVISASDTVVLYGDVTLTGDMVVLGNLIVKDIPSGSALTLQAIAPALGAMSSTIELPPPA